MNQFIIVLLLASIPALGKFGGGIAAELFKISQRTLGIALHGATGVIFAVISIELIPRSFAASNPLLITLTFIAGGLFFVLIDQFIIPKRSLVKNASVWALFIAVAVESFTDGLMIGTGVLIALTLGLLLSLGQVSVDIPMGFVNIASFKKNGFLLRKRILINLAASLAVFVGAILGYFAIKGQPPIVIFALLSFTAGILLTVTVEEIIPQSHREGEARLAALALIGGFALFALLSTYLT
jgi:ZIP family zinc transporter